MSLIDATNDLQQAISQSCATTKELRLNKGDYAVTSLTIPKGCSLIMYSKDRVRILYTGKRNRPMFILEDNSRLALSEKLEIYYNTNNIQEVTRLMIRRPESATFEISKNVKVSFFSVKQ